MYGRGYLREGAGIYGRTGDKTGRGSPRLQLSGGKWTGIYVFSRSEVINGKFGYGADTDRDNPAIISEIAEKRYRTCIAIIC